MHNDRLRLVYYPNDNTATFYYSVTHKINFRSQCIQKVCTIVELNSVEKNILLLLKM